MSVLSPRHRRAAACAVAGLALFVATRAQAQTAAQQPPAPPADAQQIRQELDRLRQEFEAIRDAYGARLAALEAKLGTATPPTPAAAPHARCTG